MSVTTDIKSMITELQSSLSLAISDMITWRPTTFLPAIPDEFVPEPVEAFDGSDIQDQIEAAAVGLGANIDADMTALPEFNSTAPDPLTISEIPFEENPLRNFDGEQFRSPQYMSPIFDAVEAELLADLQAGRTGIPAAVEAEIWNREAERDLIALNRSLKLAGDTFARKAFSLPPGKLDAKRQELLDGYNNTLNTRSREVAEKQADMSLETRKLAINGLIETQKAQMDFTLRYGGFLFSIAKETVDAMILIYNSRVARWSAELEGYKTEANVYESKVRAYVAQFSALVEKARAQGLLSAQVLDAKVKGILSTIEVAKINKNVEVENVRTSAEAYRVIETALTSRIQVLAEQIKAENAVHLDAQKAAAEMIKGLMTVVNTSDANITVQRIASGV